VTLHEILAIGSKAIGMHEAKTLLSHITGFNHTEIVINNNQPLDSKAEGAFFAGLDRRLAKEPLQYIIGEWGFMGLDIKTDRRALIPRPETELLVEEALTYIRKLEPPVKVLDLCTGSGCIAVSIAKLSSAIVTVVDISKDALALAKENAVYHDLDQQINFIQSDLFSTLGGQNFDIIISNPPYICAKDLSKLQPEIFHEPMLALDGGIDGMDIYRKLIPQALDFLAPNGKLMLEIGPSAVETIMVDAGYDIVQMKKDYSGHDRILVGQKYGGKCETSAKRIFIPTYLFRRRRRHEIKNV